MRICPRCGKPHSLDHRFCGFCGCNLNVKNMSNFVTQLALNSSNIQFDLALLYYQEGKYAQALEVFVKILEDNPEDDQAQDWHDRTLKALSQ